MSVACTSTCIQPFSATRLNDQTSDATSSRPSPCNSLVIYTACPIAHPKRIECALSTPKMCSKSAAGRRSDFTGFRPAWPCRPSQPPRCCSFCCPLVSYYSANESANSFPLQHSMSTMSTMNKRKCRRQSGDPEFTYTSLEAFSSFFSPPSCSACLDSELFCSCWTSCLSFAHCDAPSSKSF